MDSFFEIHTKEKQALPFLLFSVGESLHQPPILRPFGYSAHQFLWVIEGCGKFTVDKDTFEVSRGEGVFIRAGVFNSYSGEQFYTRWVSFHLDPSVLDHLGVKNYLRFSVPPYLDNAFLRLHHTALSSGTAWSRSAPGYTFVNELFCNILDANDSIESNVSRLLECRFSEPLTLDEIAESVGMNRFSICRYYSKNVGTSVMGELLRIRIEKAKHFLRYGNEPVGKIANMCGFESAGYFGKRFREWVGCTPLEYRKHHSESAHLSFR